MPIVAYTGLPGHGKTSFMIQQLLDDAAKAERPLFAFGVDGLQPGLATILPDPRLWNSVRSGEVCTCHATENSEPCDAHVIPNGAKIYVDEAWKWFGHLQNATRQATPEHVLQLAEHRHRGIDFVWTFQQPVQIYPFARGLISDHYHFVRRFGTSFVDVFHWQELNEDVKSSAKRDAAERSTRTLPATAWKAFKSAEVHTIKRKIPVKVWALPFMAIAALGLFWFAIYALRKPADTAASDHAAVQAQGAPATAPNGGRPDAPRFASVSDYVQAHQPRIATMPWSATIYDGRRPTADPDLYCMSSGPGVDASGRYGPSETCSCVTEQGTPYALTMNECKMVAAKGAPYNPYRQRRDSSVSPRRDDSAPPVDRRPQGVAPVSAADPSAFGDIAHYGSDGLQAY